MASPYFPDRVDAAADSWAAALALFADAQPGGFHRSGTHGTMELFTGAPMPLLNGVFGTARRADATEVAACAASPRLTAAPWSLQVRGDRVDPAIEDIAAAHGLRQRSTLPFMLKALTEQDAMIPGPGSGGPRARSVGGEEGGLYRDLLAAGAEGPPGLFDVFVTPALLDHPRMRAYVLEAGGGAGGDLLRCSGGRRGGRVQRHRPAAAPAARLRPGGYARGSAGRPRGWCPHRLPALHPAGCAAVRGDGLPHGGELDGLHSVTSRPPRAGGRSRPATESC